MKLIRRLVALLFACLVPCAAAAAETNGPSAAFKAAQDRFEAAYLRSVETLAGGANGGASELLSTLLKRAGPIAEEAFGANWSVVGEETRRQIDQLETFDLAPYASVTPVQPWADGKDIDQVLKGRLESSPGMLAALRYFDPRVVANSLASALLGERLGLEGYRQLAMVSVFVPTRVYRGRLEDRAVLVARQGSWLVVVPYEVNAFGLITPDPPGARIYPLQ